MEFLRISSSNLKFGLNVCNKSLLFWMHWLRSTNTKQSFIFLATLWLGVMYYSPIKEDPSGKKTHQVWWGSEHLFLLFIFASRSLEIFFSKAAFPFKIFHTTTLGDIFQNLKIKMKNFSFSIRKLEKNLPSLMRK